MIALWGNVTTDQSSDIAFKINNKITISHWAYGWSIQHGRQGEFWLKPFSTKVVDSEKYRVGYYIMFVQELTILY